MQELGRILPQANGPSSNLSCCTIFLQSSFRHHFAGFQSECFEAGKKALLAGRCCLLLFLPIIANINISGIRTEREFKYDLESHMLLKSSFAIIAPH